MITKEMYIKCVNDLERYIKIENLLYDLGVYLSEQKEIQQLIVNYTKLLAYCTKDLATDKYTPNNLEYYMWDCEFGKRSDEYYIKEADGTIVRFIDASTLWDYLVKNNPDIEDKEGDNGS